jgi:membrane-bound lytic murein transglycosylase D
MKTTWFGIIITVALLLAALLTFFGFSRQENPQQEPGLINAGEHYYKLPPLPDTLSFMGEPVPLSRFDVRESLERELLVNSYFHSQTIRFIKLAPRFFKIIGPILEEEGVPSDFCYLAVAESNMNPKAVSTAGAVGFWQFTAATASDYGLEVTPEVDERYHIELSTRAACRFLKSAYAKYGSWALVAAAYNAGRTSVDRQLARQKVSNYYDLLMGEETERYVFRILALKLIMQNPVKYGFQIPDEEKYPVWNTRKVEISGPIANLADFAIENGITYKTLKYYNPWLRDNVLTNKQGKKYFIELPVSE